MTPNKTQQNKLIELFEETILTDEYTRIKGPFTFKVYSSQDSEKIVIGCHESTDMIMFYVFDYMQQEYLPNCDGINWVDNDKTRCILNCEMIDYPHKIFYQLDNNLTQEFNNTYKS